VFGAGDDMFDFQIKSLALLTARAGYASTNILAYVKGGIAIADTEASVSDTTGPSTGSGSSRAWRSGPTIGAGLEYGMTPQMSIALEYDYVYLPSATYEIGGSTASYSWDVEARNISIVLAKLNYRFATR
jgi:outer membrane immunogenic protein